MTEPKKPEPSKPAGQAGTGAGSNAAGRRTPAAAAGKVPAAKHQRTLRERLGGLYTNATLVGVTGVVILIVAGLVVYGSWDAYIRPGAQTAVKVGNRTYDMEYFTRRMKAYLNEPAGAALTSPQQLATVPGQLATDIIEEEVLLQRGGSLGIGVADNDIDKDLAAKARAVVTQDDSGNVSRSPNTDLAIRELLRPSGLSLAQYRRLLHGILLKAEARKHFQDMIPNQLPQARLRLLTVADEAKAKDLKGQLDGGADFAQLATQNSLDSATRGQGGLRDWTPKGQLPTALDDAAFSLAVNTLSDPIKVDERWALLKVEERSDARDVTEQQRSALATKQYTDWLEAQKKELKVENKLDDPGRQKYAFNKSGALERVQQQNTRQPTNPVPNLPAVTVNPTAALPPAPPPDSVPSPAATPPPGATP
ncbi:MAG: peptidylprolyl isomerase [Chloroflexi bacterium]|nr:peptidylprolyl isomerase [Chloroflexota bacterium]